MDDFEAAPQQQPVPQERERRELTPLETRQVVCELLRSLKDPNDVKKLRRGALTDIAKMFHVHPRTISRVWARAIQNYENPHVRTFRASPRKNQTGRKSQWIPEEVREAVKELPIHRRKSLRSLSGALGIPLTSLFRMKQQRDADSAVILPHTNSLKPLLTPEHQFQRVCYAVMHLNENDHKYDGFYQHVHVDEKWFFLTEQHMRMYLAPGEEAPLRVSQKKDHIVKVMFLAAVARPRYNENGECTFDGKIGMWPFVERVAAQRRSANRERGAIVTTPISCTRRIYRRMLVEDVIPAIKAKWPDRNRDIVLQQDGASAHIPADDMEFGLVARSGTWNINILTQPPKSPDTNVCDLSFFRALQSEQWRSGIEDTIDGLITQVLRTFERFNERKNDFGFLTLQCCLDDILIRNGGNDYSIRHMGKERMLREGILPDRIEASEAAIHTFNFVTNPPRLREDDDANGDANNAAVDYNLQQQPQQMINNLAHERQHEVV
jgi:hypothetical protein